MHITASQLLDLDVSRSEIEAKLSKGEWRRGEQSGNGGVKDQTVLVASLPRELQVGWMRAHALCTFVGQDCCLTFGSG